MGMEKVDFGWYAKRISLYALLGYLGGIKGDGRGTCRYNGVQRGAMVEVGIGGTEPDLRLCSSPAW